MEKIAGVLVLDEHNNLILRFKRGDLSLSDVSQEDVFKANASGLGPLNALVAECFGVSRKEAKGEQIVPVVAIGNIIRSAGTLKTDEDEYGHIKRGLKRLTPRNKASAKSKAATVSAEFCSVPSMLDQYEILIMLELLARKPQMEEWTSTSNINQIRAGSTIAIREEDFAELAKHIYGQNSKIQRRAVFDRLRAIANSEFGIVVPEYGTGKRGWDAKPKRLYGQIISCSYGADDETKEDDAHKIFIGYTELFYYLDRHLYATIDIRALEQAARKKGGGVVLRAVLFAAVEQPRRVMHFKHGGNKYVTFIPYRNFFDRYDEKTKQRRYDDRAKFSPAVMDEIKLLTGGENVEKTDSGISITFAP